MMTFHQRAIQRIICSPVKKTIRQVIRRRILLWSWTSRFQIFNHWAKGLRPTLMSHRFSTAWKKIPFAAIYRYQWLVVAQHVRNMKRWREMRNASCQVGPLLIRQTFMIIHLLWCGHCASWATRPKPFIRTTSAVGIGRALINILALKILPL